MKHALHSPDFLRKRAVMRLTFAAMIASAILAPLILSTFCLPLNGLRDSNENYGPNGITVELLAAAVLAMVPAACLGGLAMHRGATSRNEASTLGWSVLGGVLFLGACVCCASISMIGADDSGPTGLEVLGLALLFTTLGSIVSGPTGFAFGLLFLIALSPLTSRLARPSIVTPADATRGAAVLLLVASGVATICAAVVHVHVANFARDHLALDTPWLAFALFPLPLALSAFVFELKSLLETRTILRLRNAILSDAHPEYHPGDIPPEEDATPLTELDRKSTDKRVLVVRASSAYRGGEARSARVYVGVSAM